MHLYLYKRWGQLPEVDISCFNPPFRYTYPPVTRVGDYSREAFIMTTTASHIHTAGWLASSPRFTTKGRLTINPNPLLSLCGKVWGWGYRLPEWPQLLLLPPIPTSTGTQTSLSIRQTRWLDLTGRLGLTGRAYGYMIEVKYIWFDNTTYTDQEISLFESSRIHARISYT